MISCSYITSFLRPTSFILNFPYITFEPPSLPPYIQYPFEILYRFSHFSQFKKKIIFIIFRIFLTSQQINLKYSSKFYFTFPGQFFNFPSNFLECLPKFCKNLIVLPFHRFMPDHIRNTFYLKVLELISYFNVIGWNGDEVGEVLLLPSRLYHYLNSFVCFDHPVSGLTF